jgi:minor extracellular serine protease Vpr
MKAGVAISWMLVALSTACGGSTPSSHVSAISLSPSPCVLSRTNSKQLTAHATMPDGTKRDVSGEASWKTDNPNTVTVDKSGVVVGVNVGVTKITVMFEGATGTEECTVTP